MTLRRKDNTIFLEKKDGKKKYIPIEKVESVYLFGEVNFNSRLLAFISQNQVLIHVFNINNWYVGSFVPRKQKVSGKLLIEQVKAFLNDEKRLSLAKEFINASMKNMIRICQRARNRIKNEEKLEKLGELYQKFQVSSSSINEIMAYEGLFRQIYYELLSEITLENFERREKQPPIGRLNCLISFGNSILYTHVLNKIYQTQLDPTISFLHEPCEMRFSLSLDIAEIFKPLIIDRLIINLLNKNILKKEADFDENFDSTLLNKSGANKFLREFQNFLGTTVMYPKLKRKVSYDTLIKLECYKLIRSLVSNEKYEALRMWW